MGAALGASDVGVNRRKKMGNISGVRGAAAGCRNAFRMLFADERAKILIHKLCQRLVGNDGEITGKFCDLTLRADGVSAGLQGPVDLPAGVQDRFYPRAAHVGLDPDVGGNDIDQVAALCDNGMDADMILVAEGFPLRVNGGQADFSGV